MERDETNQSKRNLMHPSLQHRYGLKSAQDVGIANSMIAAAYKAGWSRGDVDALLQHYASFAGDLQAGRITGEQVVQELWSYADRVLGVQETHRAALLDWHATTGEYMRLHSEGVPPLEKPSREGAAAERAEIERILAEEPEKYWKDPTLQNRLYELIQLSGGEPAPAPAIATPAHVSRLTELEGMMGDHSSAYWNGAQSSALQAEYRNILSLAPPAAPGGGQSSAGDGATSGAEQ